MRLPLNIDSTLDLFLWQAELISWMMLYPAPLVRSDVILSQSGLRHTENFEGNLGFHMSEPQFQQVQESISAVALNTQIEFIRGMKDEFSGPSSLALDDS